MLKLSASAVALTLGLLLASAIMATQTAGAEPPARMNPALHPTLAAGHPYVPAPVAFTADQVGALPLAGGLPFRRFRH